MKKASKQYLESLAKSCKKKHKTKPKAGVLCAFEKNVKNIKYYSFILYNMWSTKETLFILKIKNILKKKLWFEQKGLKKHKKDTKSILHIL